MNFLFETECSNFRTLFFSIPIKNLKVKIEVSKTSNRNSVISVLYNFRWNELFTDKFYVLSSNLGNTQTTTIEIQQKIPDWNNKLSVLLN